MKFNIGHTIGFSFIISVIIGVIILAIKDLILHYKNEDNKESSSE